MLSDQEMAKDAKCSTHLPDRNMWALVGGCWACLFTALNDQRLLTESQMHYVIRAPVGISVIRSGFSLSAPVPLGF